MLAGLLFGAIALVFTYKAGYDAGRRAGRAESDAIIDTLQYPPGCSCIKNALMPSARCPRHGKFA